MAEAKPTFVPESTLKKRKRNEQWESEAKEKALAERKKARESRKLIFTRAKQYAEEYDAKVKPPRRIPVPICGCDARLSVSSEFAGNIRAHFLGRKWDCRSLVHCLSSDDATVVVDVVSDDAVNLLC
jgi:hypothetical protein